MSDPTPTSLDQALETYRASLSGFPMPAEQALLVLVTAMAEELRALRAQPGQSPAIGSPASVIAADGGQSDLRGEMQRLHERHTSDYARLLSQVNQEIATLRRDLSFIQSPQPAQPVEDSDLRVAIQALRSEVARLTTQSSRGIRSGGRSELPGGPAPMRPVEELLDDAPQIEGDYSTQQLADYLSRPRVRPEDIVVSQEELARQPGRRGQIGTSRRMHEALGPQVRTRQEVIQGWIALAVIMAILLACFFFFLFTLSR